LTLGNLVVELVKLVFFQQLSIWVRLENGGWAPSHGHLMGKIMIEGSLEVKLPTTWTD
jgi:hypothetical protein